MNDARRERIVAATTALRAAERPIRILGSVAWSRDLRVEFFSDDCQNLPRPIYPRLELTESTRAAVRDALRDLPPPDERDVIDQWLARQGNALETSAQMLDAIGTPAFHEHSCTLYGAPTDPMFGGDLTALDTARTIDELAGHAAGIDLGAPAPACHLAEHVAAQMRTAVNAQFGEEAPEVAVVDELSANALAGPNAIRLRRAANFSDVDVNQLIQHEAFVHVCTSLNGRAQDQLPILAAGHAGTTKTQEGLAVFAEFISGAMDPSRMRRLADRVLAIQMACEGADFIDVFRFFRDRTDNANQAYENARRVFRGGVVTGGAPFTKDLVYLDGLLRVTNFMQIAIVERRADCLTLLFSGKLDVEDIPALAALRDAGLCRPPKFLPPWLADRRFLVSQLTFNRALHHVPVQGVRAHYREMFESLPPAPQPPTPGS